MLIGKLLVFLSPLISKNFVIQLTNMIFRDRTEAGEKLAEKIIQRLYPVSNIPRDKDKDKDVIIYALPRGGVVLGDVVAKKLSAPLDIVISKKIGHPYSPEYAIGGVSEDGHTIFNEEEKRTVDQKWLEKEIKAKQNEAIERRKKYFGDKPITDAKGKTAIIVDDGIATGLTMELAISEIKHLNPKKIIVAIPVVPYETAEKIKKEVDELVALDIDKNYMGAVGAYYEYFPQVEDTEVIKILKHE